MTEFNNQSPKPIFDPSLFIDDDTGQLDNLLEFDQQCAALIASGNVEPVLTFFADKMNSDDEDEIQLYRSFLMDLMQRTDNPEAVLFHATHLHESEVATGNYFDAAITSSIASSVCLEKGRFKDAALWFTNMRKYLRAHTYESTEDKNPFIAASRPKQLFHMLEFEGFYMLKLAGLGKDKQIRKDIAEYDKEPCVPAERHWLASNLAWIESDQGNHSYAHQALKKAERLAVEQEDYADASIYANRRATQALLVFGSIAVTAPLKASEEYLKLAMNSDNEPDRIAAAKSLLEDKRRVL